MPEKKQPEERGDVRTKEALRNKEQTEERIQEEYPKDNRREPSNTDRSQVAEGGEESKHGRKQKGNSDGT